MNTLTRLSNPRKRTFNQFLGWLNYSMTSVIISKLNTLQIMDQLDDDVETDTKQNVLRDHKINVLATL